MTLELGEKLTIYSDDPDRYISLEVIGNGLNCTLTNEFVPYFMVDNMEVRKESTNFIINRKRLSDINDFIDDFKNNTLSNMLYSFQLPLKLVKKAKNGFTHKGKKTKEISTPLELIIRQTRVENMKGLDFEIPHTKIYCDIELGADLDKFQSFINDYLSK